MRRDADHPRGFHRLRFPAATDNAWLARAQQNYPALRDVAILKQIEAELPFLRLRCR
jgi:hypothetical protein